MYPRHFPTIIPSNHVAIYFVNSIYKKYFKIPVGGNGASQRFRLRLGNINILVVCEALVIPIPNIVQFQTRYHHIDKTAQLPQISTKPLPFATAPARRISAGVFSPQVVATNIQYIQFTPRHENNANVCIEFSTARVKTNNLL